MVFAAAAHGADKFKVEPVVAAKAAPFSVADVRLLDGPFKRAMDANGEWLMQLEADRLLAWFRKDAGLTPKAAVYGGWESMGVAGHSLGHYLTACAYMYAATGDVRFRERVNYIVDELALCQDAHGDGYVGAMPEGRRVFDEVARGDIRSKGFDLNGLWVPWYTTHKVMAGLRDVYLLCDNAKAKDVLVKLADYAWKIMGGLNDEQVQKMLLCEHGGMNELAADVYALTGDRKYLSLAERFNHKQVLDPLSRGEDRLSGFHANTQVPKLIGCARQHELTGEPYHKHAAEFFWRTVVDNHTYVIGGNSNGEYFGQPGKLNDRLSDHTCETCNTYNMLKLTRSLYSWQADPQYIDYYERALYNHILASQDPETGRVCYFVSLKQGTKKEENRGYSTLADSFWCCTGTGMENPARYGETIYFHSGNDLYVNLFIASKVDWRQKGLTITQQTAFPEADTSRFVLRCDKPVDAAICLRYPAWAGKKTQVRVNGAVMPLEAQPGQYIRIARTWKSGDVVEMRFDMALYIEAMPDNADRIAVLYGPMVLAGDFGDTLPAPWIPVLMTDNANAADWLRPVTGKNNTFRTADVGRPQDVTFVPFYSLHHRYYSVYFDRFTEAQWQSRKGEYERQIRLKKELEAITVDYLQPGEMQPERDHNLDGERTRTGAHNGRKWRDAWDGGYFAFDMKVSGDAPVDLVCTYWGGDGGARTFDIIVDDKILATQTLSNKKPGEFYDERYALPADLTGGKSKVRVKLQAHPDNMAGGLFGCRVVRRVK
ncbi:MAG: glycoside hydrolase family 127 protein [Phycisphaerae bacterium]|nr:glycoside hydrolase family 127 protein [Phycisphaerae bacterium]